MNEENRSIARDHLERAMTDRRMSNVALAVAAGVDPKTVNNFLGKAARWPQRETRAKLSAAVGWPSDELDYIERHGEPSPAGRDEVSTGEPAVDEVPRRMLAIESVFRLLPGERHEEAQKAAIVALLAFLDVEGAEQLGTALRKRYPPNIYVDEAAYHPDGD